MSSVPGRPALARHVVSVIGVFVTTSSAVLFLVLFALDLLGYLANPYIGLVLFVALPAAFLAGLALIPIGVWRERRRIAGGLPASTWPRFDLNDPAHRRTAALMLLATMLNVGIVSMAAYGGIHYMETPAFCGQVCHGVMQPEFVAYQVGPHARVACVQCHVGSGVPSLVRSKLNGTRQLLGVLTGRYDRPIPVPVRNLRPARDTCERCHWPEQMHGDRIRLIREYADDEQNTESVTKLTVHVGGGSDKLGIATGIHWHMNLANEVEYIASDDKRQVIPYVRLKDRRGGVREYVAPGMRAELMQTGERRRMDCMDCHSRPSHTFISTPQRAVDEAIAQGRISRSLPFVRRESIAALEGKYASREAAAEAIADRLRRFYQETSRKGAAGPNGSDLDRATGVVQALYAENVFPSMNVRWGTYPNDLGHVDSPGCFRCHDDEHKAPDGKVIRQDCEICHQVEQEGGGS